MNDMIIVCHSLKSNTLMGLVISLCLNANPLIRLIPRMASNFRHLLSCGTIGLLSMSLDCATESQKENY